MIQFTPELLDVVFNGAALCFVILCAIQLRRYQNFYFFQQRRFPLCVAEMSLLGLSAVLDIVLSGMKKFEVPDNARIAASAIFLVTLSSLFAVMCMRIYFLNYDHQYEEARLNQKWVENIDFQHKDKQNWYIKNRETWGNTFWMAKTTMWPLFLNIPMAWGPKDSLIVFLASRIVGGLLHVMCISIILVAWCKLPTEYDRLFVRSEMQFSLVWAVILGIYQASFLLCPSAEKVSTPGCYARAILGTLPIICDAWSTSIYVIRSNLAQATNTSETTEDVKGLNFWMNYVESDRGFELFARFLTREFSIENLLFITEYMRLKCVHNDEIVRVLAQPKKPRGFWLQMPSKMLPRASEESSILNVAILHAVRSESNSSSDLDGMADIFSFGEFLFEKYVDHEEARFEINISSDCRMELEGIFATAKANRFSIFQSVSSTVNVASLFGTQDGPENPIDEDMSPDERDRKIVNVFDQCAREVSSLLQDSFSRFRATPEYLGGLK